MGKINYQQGWTNPQSNNDKYFENKLKCSFEQWYRVFKNNTFSSIVIPLPKIFIDYLNSDHFTMSEESFPEFRTEDNGEDDEEWSSTTPSDMSTKLDKRYYQSYDSESESESDNEQDEDDEDEDEKEKDNNNNNNNNKTNRKISEKDFPELIKEIEDAIAKLGGEVVPKLNWSSPKDATWMNIHSSLKCLTPTDVLLLLKSSDFINHDLCQFQIEKDQEEILKDDSISPFTLVLRKYHNLFHSMEFRCFVKNNQLIAISQRDTSTYYKFLQEKKQHLQDLIQQFFNTIVKDKFDDINYTFDVYITRDDKVYLMDFNPIHPSTDALLFDWEELFEELMEEKEEKETNNNNNNQNNNNNNNTLEFRIIENNEGIKPNLAMTI
ncbi:cell division cycle protein [Cavenderia fasciculata]|uniref:Cell division cycle protein n=1 Tax=Cavenderia fasciculata TaxID=261658 RepID=F4PQB9_CACFS|nr:cell division cycle protein [Cavenderia fasciculata]EGG22582.1 cell division cycle protein [Cavenderia fasciculata]|eukprot:XP_004360433.1 cell division cycle protein [Cavenderia fasciculata]